MEKVAFRNLGCKVNEYEMEYMQQRMAENGFEIVPFDSKADIFVINTCTVTNIADRKSRQMLHRAKKMNPDSIVVAVGCFVQTDTEGAAKDSAVDIIIGNNKKSLLPEIVREYLDTGKYTGETVVDLTKPVEYENMHIEKTAEHTRAFVKIQDGCNQFCSYCAIPLARGRIRSRDLESILSECRALSKNGYREVVITGIHLSSYGLTCSYNSVAGTDGYTNQKLIEVIREVARIEGIDRIRLGSLEPRLITEEFLKEVSKIDKLCPHFHLSLQSGCDETLKRMNRKYTTKEFAGAVELLRKYYENPAITTDVIVGFPGETEEEFEETEKFLRKMAFSKMHIFKYSRRKNTVADTLPLQVSDRDKDIRSDKLLKLSDELGEKYKRLFDKKEVEVLFEECKNGEYTGHTREYLIFRTASSEKLCGKIVRMNADGESLYFE